MPIEIDENEYAELRRVREIAALIEKDPKARVKLQEAVQIVAPDQVGPEIRIRNEVAERIGGLEKTIGDFIESQTKDRDERRAARERDALERRWAESRAKAQSAGYTEDGLKELEDYMEKNGIADHEIAIPAFERLHPPPEPVASGNSRWDFFGPPPEGGQEAGLDALMNQNYDAFEALAIPAALRDVRSR